MDLISKSLFTTSEEKIAEYALWAHLYIGDFCYQHAGVPDVINIVFKKNKISAVVFNATYIVF